MVAVYGKGMHEFVLREIELGYRAAVTEDQERADCYPPAIEALQFEEYIRGQEEYESVSRRIGPRPA